MFKTVTEKREYCDICKKRVAWYHCLACNKAYCYECGKTEAVEYNHGVFFAGSGDGHYCKECDHDLSLCPACEGFELHDAYLNIQALREENDKFYADFKKRSDAAERRIEVLNAKRKR
jgi:hypothetical protein